MSNEEYETTFQTVLDAVFAGHGAPVSASEIHSMCSVLAARSTGNEAYILVSERLRNFASSIPDSLRGVDSPQDIGEFWAGIKSRRNFITATFSPLCLCKLGHQGLDELFEQELVKSWHVHRDVFSWLTNVILKAYDEYRTTKDVTKVAGAFAFARDSGVFREIFMERFTNSVVEHLAPAFDTLFELKLQEYLKRSAELADQETALAEPLIGSGATKELVLAINHLVFVSKLERIYKSLNVLIEEGDVESVDLCARYARATDKIKEFTRELSFEIELVAENCFKLENPIQELMKVHDVVVKVCAKSFNAQHSRTLRTEFEKGMNTSPVVAKLLAEDIHRRFVAERNVPKADFDGLISLFRLLNEKDVFEANHHLLMCRRILMMKNHIIHSDELFLSELRKQCGPDYTKRLDEIFKDLQDSVEITRQFTKGQSGPSPFNALVIRSEAWLQLEVTGRNSTPPANVATALHNFTRFYLTRNSKRKIDWNMAFTRVKLRAINVPNINEVKCNGLYALILMEFNNSTTVQFSALEKRLGLTKEQVETLLKVLKSHTFGKIVSCVRSCCRLNMTNTVTDGVVSLPFTFPSLPRPEDTSTSWIQNSRGCQVEAVVMMIMKKERSMEKDALKEKARDLLTFRLEDELYENRLAHLEKISYLKLDPSGQVHYLP